jgi:hypothetical protein
MNKRHGLTLFDLESLTKLEKVSPTDQRTSQREKGFMNVCTPLIAYPQPAPLRQPCQGPFHDPAIDAQATAVGCPAFGQHGGDPQRSQLPPVRLRIIPPVPLDPARPTAGAPTLPPHGRDGLQQGQQLGHVVPMRPGHQRRQWNPLGIREYMMFTAALPAIGGIGAGFFPHRRPPEGSDYPRLRGTNRSGPPRGAWPGAWHGAVAKRLYGANHVSAASTSSRSRSPSPGGASPRECRTSAQREYPLTWLDSGLAVCLPAVWSAQRVTVAQAVPTVRRVQVVWPCTQDTLK